MPGRMFTLNLSAVAFTAAFDAFEIQPGDDKPVLIHALRLWQTTDLGDAAEEVLSVSLVRGHTSGGNGTSQTPVAKDNTDSASGATCEVGASTIASAGTTTIPYSTGWNVRAPLEVIFTPECRPRADQGNTTIVLRVSAPADSITVSGSIDFEEL